MWIVVVEEDLQNGSGSFFIEISFSCSSSDLNFT